MYLNAQGGGVESNGGPASSDRAILEPRTIQPDVPPDWLEGSVEIGRAWPQNVTDTLRYSTM